MAEPDTRLVLRLELEQSRGLMVVALLLGLGVILWTLVRRRKPTARPA